MVNKIPVHPAAKLILEKLNELLSGIFVTARNLRDDGGGLMIHLDNGVMKLPIAIPDREATMMPCEKCPGKPASLKVATTKSPNADGLNIGQPCIVFNGSESGSGSGRFAGLMVGRTANGEPLIRANLNKTIQ